MPDLNQRTAQHLAEDIDNEFRVECIGGRTETHRSLNADELEAVVEIALRSLRSLPVEQRMEAMAMRPWTSVTQGVYCEADDIETVIEAGVNADE